MVETQIRHASSPLSGEQQSKEAVVNHEIEVELGEQPIQSPTSESSQPPLSKARTIALVATLTGAAFLKLVSQALTKQYSTADTTAALSPSKPL